VPDERDVLGADLLDHGDNVVAEGREVPVVAPEARLAMAPDVERDDVVPLGQEVDLAGPVGAVAGPPVDQDDRESVTADATMGLVRKLDAVAAAGHEVEPHEPHSRSALREPGHGVAGHAVAARARMPRQDAAVVGGDLDDAA
jgi:hypothetical protein